VLEGVTGFGQDLHHGQRHRPVRPAGAGDLAQQDPGRAALRGVQTCSCRTTRCSTSSATSTTTSPRPTSRAPTPSSRRIPAINEEIERLRLAATDALLNRTDVVIIASVSCIYGLGSPVDYKGMLVNLKAGGPHRARPHAGGSWSTSSTRATRWRPSPAPSACAATRWTFSPPTPRRGCASSSATRWSAPAHQSLTGKVEAELPQVSISPAKHFVTPYSRVQRRFAKAIEAELEERVAWNLSRTTSWWRPSASASAPSTIWR
jgi:hypothetical protein